MCVCVCCRSPTPPLRCCVVQSLRHAALMHCLSQECVPGNVLSLVRSLSPRSHVPPFRPRPLYLRNLLRQGHGSPPVSLRCCVEAARSAPCHACLQRETRHVKLMGQNVRSDVLMMTGCYSCFEVLTSHHSGECVALKSSLESLSSVVGATG